MGESFKAVCGLFIIIALIIGLFAWIDDRPGQTTWILRISTPLVAMAIAGFLFKLNRRRDLAPDFLRSVAGEYFNCGGFAFGFRMGADQGVCHLQLFFQNQFDRRCIGHVWIRPGQGFFLTRPDIQIPEICVNVDAAGFGLAYMPIAVPQKVQGKQQVFEIIATSSYPDGKGRRLRYHDGLFLRSQSSYRDTFRTGIMILGAASGTLVWSKPATITLTMPTNVADAVPLSGSSMVTVKKIWKLGDPVDQVADSKS